ncbi:MAG: hypothetical protein ACM3SX_23480 [Deltaproteobacteria bacterium]
MHDVRGSRAPSASTGRIDDGRKARSARLQLLGVVLLQLLDPAVGAEERVRGPVRRGIASVITAILFARLITSSAIDAAAAYENVSPM